MEMAVIMPIVLTATLLLMQIAMYLAVSVKAKAVCQEAMMIYEARRQEGEDVSAAQDAAGSYIERTLTADYLEASYSFRHEGLVLYEKETLYLSGTCRMLVPLSFEIVQKEHATDPATFRNRTDYIYEKLIKS